MKLLKLEIGFQPEEKQFRSLYPGFTVEFHDPTTRTQSLEKFDPFCFVGLNGTGKSNVLEALAVIFFHLECCVAKFKPDSFHVFQPENCILDAFTIEYLIQRKTGSYTVDNFDKITVRKQAGKAPVMFKQSFPPDTRKEEPVSLVPPENTDFPRAANGKDYLPDIVIGYSSGENEILSIPFRKSRFINFDKYKEDFFRNTRFEEPENSLIYIDRDMSQAVLLACLLYEDSETTLPLKKELKIIDIVSFRMHINVQMISDNDKKAPITEHIKDIVESLKTIATCRYEQIFDADNTATVHSMLTLDFLVKNSVKDAFKKLFRTSFDFFRFFQVLYELNANFIPDYVKQDVYASKGIYTGDKVPDGNPEQLVFYFQNFLILKETEKGKPPKELLLRQFSDGEHQFLHTLCICLILKDRRGLLLLDEPETHFNPEWRSKFIQILDSGIRAGGSNNLLKDIIITSHSPFIISDCAPDKVIIFEKDDQNKPVARKASDMGIQTYGTSVNLLTNSVFKEKHTIGKYALDKIDHYRKRLQAGEKIESLIDEINDELGDSIEKLILINEFIK